MHHHTSPLFRSLSTSEALLCQADRIEFHTEIWWFGSILRHKDFTPRSLVERFPSHPFFAAGGATPDGVGVSPVFDPVRCPKHGWSLSFREEGAGADCLVRQDLWLHSHTGVWPRHSPTGISLVVCYEMPSLLCPVRSATGSRVRAKYVSIDECDRWDDHHLQEQIALHQSQRR